MFLIRLRKYLEATLINGLSGTPTKSLHNFMCLYRPIYEVNIHVDGSRPISWKFSLSNISVWPL